MVLLLFVVLLPLARFIIRRLVVPPTGLQVDQPVAEKDEDASRRQKRNQGEQTISCDQRDAECAQRNSCQVGAERNQFQHRHHQCHAKRRRANGASAGLTDKEFQASARKAIRKPGRPLDELQRFSSRAREIERFSKKPGSQKC